MSDKLIRKYIHGREADLEAEVATLRAQLDEARGMRGADAGERWYLKNLQAANQDYAKQITTLRAQLAEARSGRGRAGWRE